MALRDRSRGRCIIRAQFTPGRYNTTACFTLCLNKEQIVPLFTSSRRFLQLRFFKTFISHVHASILELGWICSILNQSLFYSVLKLLLRELMYVLHELYSMYGSVSKMSETLIKQFTFCSEVFFFPLPSENNPLYFMLILNWGYSHIYTPSWLNINRNVWNHCVGLQLPSTSSVCLYFLWEALYLWTTEEHK